MVDQRLLKNLWKEETIETLIVWSKNKIVQKNRFSGLTSCFLQLSVDQITLQEQSHNIADLEEERNRLKEQLAELNQKIESLEGDNLTNAHQQRLELKVKELENKLDLEFTQRGRIENQVRPLLKSIS